MDTRSLGIDSLPALQAPGRGSQFWSGGTPQASLLQDLGIYGFPLSPDLFWARSAPGQAGKGAEARGGRQGARGGPEEARRRRAWTI